MRKWLSGLGIGTVLALASASTAFAIDADSTGLKDTGSAALGETLTTGSNTTLAGFLGARIIQPVFSIVGVIFFALMVYAGVLWMTARGDSKQVDKAKDILTTSVIGVVIVISSYVLTNAVFNAILQCNVNGGGC